MKISELSLIETAWVDKEIERISKLYNLDNPYFRYKVEFLQELKYKLLPATILAEKAFEAGREYEGKVYYSDPTACNLQNFLNEIDL